MDPEFEGIYDEDSDGSPLFSESEISDGKDETDGTGIDMLQIECMLSSLISQGLLNGFISHRLKRFAIQGAKAKGGPLAAGFPKPFAVISARMEEYDSEIPGWKKEAKASNGPGGGDGGFGSDGAGFGRGPSSGPGGGGRGNFGKIGPGTVINLKGARPAGAGP